MKKRIVSFILLVCLMLSVVGVQASANSLQGVSQNEISESLELQKELPQIELKNAKILSTKTYTQKETDKDGVEWTGSTYLVEASQPTYTSYGTAVATPIYVFTYPSTGYWKSRNTFVCMESGYTPASGTAYPGDLYIEPY